MGKQLSNKIVKFDFNFILDNYLNKKLWGKKWTIFEYDKMTVTLELYRINIIKSRVDIILRFNHDDISFCYVRGDSGWDTISFSFAPEHRNVKVFENRLFGEVIGGLSVLESLEFIQESPEYNAALRLEEENKEELKKEAEAYLDILGFTEEDVRRPFINEYINDNKENYTSAVYQKLEYTMLTEYYLMYSLFANRQDKYDELIDTLKDKGYFSQKVVDKVNNEVDDFELTDMEEV